VLQRLVALPCQVLGLQVVLQAEQLLRASHAVAVLVLLLWRLLRGWQL
jgi:hypothetical protein